MSVNFTDNVTLFDSATADVASSNATAIDVSKRDRITVVIKCANHTAGNGVFTVDASNDGGVTWVSSIAVIDAQSTTAGTYVTSKTLNTNTVGALIVPAGWQMIRVLCDISTDGSYSAWLHALG